MQAPTENTPANDYSDKYDLVLLTPKWETDVPFEGVKLENLVHDKTVLFAWARPMDLVKLIDFAKGAGMSMLNQVTSVRYIAPGTSNVLDHMSHKFCDMSDSDGESDTDSTKGDHGSEHASDDAASEADDTKRPRTRVVQAPPMRGWWNKAAKSSLLINDTEGLYMFSASPDVDISRAFKGRSPAFRASHYDVICKRSKSRPYTWDTILPPMAKPKKNEEGVRVIELFAESIHPARDTWGPSIGVKVIAPATAGDDPTVQDILTSVKKALKLNRLKRTVNRMKLVVSGGKRSSDALEAVKETIDPWLDLLKRDLECSDSDALTILYAILRQELDSRPVRKRRSGDKSSKKTSSGIASEQAITNDLAAFLGKPTDGTARLARTEGVRLINKYISSKSLQNPEMKSTVLLDEPLRKLLQPENSDPVSYFNIVKLLSKHFIKKQKDVTVDRVPSVPAPPVDPLGDEDGDEMSVEDESVGSEEEGEELEIEA